MIKKVLIGASIVVLLAGNIVQYVIWNKELDNQEMIFSEQVEQLENKISSYGTMITCFSVKDNVKAGKPIETSNLQQLTVPSAFISDNYITDANMLNGKYFKVDVTPGVPITTDIVMKDDISNDTRYLDLTADVFPVALEVGDFIDWRIVYPKGEDYIVLSKKRVLDINDTTIRIMVSEEERHIWQAALLDCFIQSSKGAYLYATLYVEPSVQENAITYYAPPENIKAMIAIDPNIDKTIYKDKNGKWRATIDAAMSAYMNEDDQETQEEMAAVSSGRSELISALQAAAAYWDSKSEEEKASQTNDDWSNEVADNNNSEYNSEDNSSDEYQDITTDESGSNEYQDISNNDEYQDLDTEGSEW